jgi:hypothetical protein
MDDVIRQAECHDTRQLVVAIFERSGDDDSHWALVLHHSLCHQSTKDISKSSGFQSKKMSALSYHSIWTSYRVSWKLDHTANGVQI